MWRELVQRALIQAGNWLLVVGAIGLFLAALSIRSSDQQVAAAPETATATATATQSETDLLVPSADRTDDPPTADPTPTPTPEPVPTATARPVSSSPPRRVPTPVPVPDPNPVLLTQEHVSGSFGQTLWLSGHSVMLRPKTTPWSTQCEWMLPDAAVFDLVITFSTYVDHPNYSQNGAGVTNCRDGDVLTPVVSGAPYELHLGVAAGSAVSIIINPNDGSHSLYFDFH